MAITTSIQTLDRISVATPYSRIAVFKKGNDLESVFADTVSGLQRIERGVGLIGVFNGTESENEVWHILKKYMNNKETLVSLPE